MRTRHRITTAILHHDGSEFRITFRPDGIHVREKFAREERLIPLANLLAAPSGIRAGVSANPEFRPGSPSEVLDVAACDLVVIACDLHHKRQIAGKAVVEVKQSLLHALKIVRSLETLS